MARRSASASGCGFSRADDGSIGGSAFDPSGGTEGGPTDGGCTDGAAVVGAQQHPPSHPSLFTEEGEGRARLQAPAGATAAAVARTPRRPPRLDDGNTRFGQDRRVAGRTGVLEKAAHAAVRSLPRFHAPRATPFLRPHTWATGAAGAGECWSNGSWGVKDIAVSARARACGPRTAARGTPPSPLAASFPIVAPRYCFCLLRPVPPPFSPTAPLRCPLAVTPTATDTVGRGAPPAR